MNRYLVKLAILKPPSQLFGGDPSKAVWARLDHSFKRVTEGDGTMNAGSTITESPVGNSGDQLSLLTANGKIAQKPTVLERVTSLGKTTLKTKE
jgi:hypothetical protein